MCKAWNQIKERGPKKKKGNSQKIKFLWEIENGSFWHRHRIESNRVIYSCSEYASWKQLWMQWTIPPTNNRIGLGKRQKLNEVMVLARWTQNSFIDQVGKNKSHIDGCTSDHEQLIANTCRLMHTTMKILTVSPMVSEKYMMYNLNGST